MKNKVEFLKELRENNTKEFSENITSGDEQNTQMSQVPQMGPQNNFSNSASMKNLLNLNSNNSNDFNFNVNVLVKDKKFKIFCGDGRQKLRWLSDVAIFKYESYNEGYCGLAYSIKLENGNLCDLNDSISMVLHNNENVWVLLKEEYDVYQEDLMKKFTNENLYKSTSNFKK